MFNTIGGVVRKPGLCTRARFVIKSAVGQRGILAPFARFERAHKSNSTLDCPINKAVSESTQYISFVNRTVERTVALVRALESRKGGQNPSLIHCRLMAKRVHVHSPGLRTTPRMVLNHSFDFRQLRINRETERESNPLLVS